MVSLLDVIYHSWWSPSVRDEFIARLRIIVSELERRALSDDAKIAAKAKCIMIDNMFRTLRSRV